MVATRSWKAVRGLVEDGRCRVCDEQSETVEHLVAGCKVLANSEYLSRHNRALMIIAVEWAKDYDLIGMDNGVVQRMVGARNSPGERKSKTGLGFEFHLRKTMTARRPDLILEEKGEKCIWICVMAFPQQHNLETKRVEKLTKY